MICKHAQIRPGNCDGGIPSRKIVCAAGNVNTCLVNCGKQCSHYEPRVKSYQRILPQNINSAQTQQVGDVRVMPISIKDSPQDAVPDTNMEMIRNQAMLARQQAALYKERMGSLPKGNCSTCGGGNSAAMR